MPKLHWPWASLISFSFLSGARSAMHQKASLATLRSCWRCSSQLWKEWRQRRLKESSKLHLSLCNMVVILASADNYCRVVARFRSRPANHNSQLVKVVEGPWDANHWVCTLDKLRKQSSILNQSKCSVCGILDSCKRPKIQEKMGNMSMWQQHKSRDIMFHHPLEALSNVWNVWNVSMKGINLAM